MNISPIGHKLSIRDRLLVLQVSLLIPIVELWVRKKGYKHCLRGLEKIANFLPKRKQGPNRKLAEHLTNLVDKGNKQYSIYIAECLTRSLVLQFILKRRGLKSKILIGVRTLTGQFEAHAWVEYDGVPLGEDESVRLVYKPFESKDNSDFGMNHR